MDWWIWLVVGLALLLLEVATPGGFYFIFFGAGALIVGLLTSIGVLSTAWVQWMLFSVFAVGTTALFRRPLLRRFGAGVPSPTVDSLVGEMVTVLDSIQPGGLGKAELRGTSWSLCNEGQEGLNRGQRCRVQRVDGLTLFVNGAVSPGASS